MTDYVVVVPPRIYDRVPDGEQRWCFRCRKRRAFKRTMRASHYGLFVIIACENGHVDGDCFPGTWRVLERVVTTADVFPCGHSREGKMHR